ncbi:MAG: hypothetical protein Q9M94_03855 [Candidatus Gracilibacteria bacterium]|nr:hypothetical protein [Candidatus Gracilibacteria bacterium]MDQ7022232.1 hypothetical protein [Candidatus Gracilibacteria bacterium]
MSNRLIGLLIILFFIILGLFYYYGVENNKNNNINIKTKNIENIKKINIKKATLVLIKKEQKSNNSILSLTEEEKAELKNKNILKIKNKVSKILKINNLKYIQVSEIIGDENLFLINLIKNNSNISNYIYNNKISNLEKNNLNIEILYAKKINSKIHFITEKGTFILKNKKVEYFPTFSDFIINNYNYIGIIKSKDKSRKTNFNYSQYSGDLIVLYNPKKSIKRILYKPNFEIKNIYLENEKIIIIDEEEKKYLLEY